MNNLKKKYNSQLNTLFNTFIKENINGIQFKILPKQSDIPIIKTMGYTIKEDLFEIVFNIIDRDEVKYRKINNIVFVQDQKERLVAFKICNFKKTLISEIKLTLNANLDQEIKNINFQLGNGKGDINIKIIEKRKLKYLKDSISKNLAEVSRIDNNKVSHDINNC